MEKIKLVHVQVLPILTGAQKISLNIFRNLDPERYDMYLICAPESLEYEYNNNSLIIEAKKLSVTVIILQSLKREIGLHDFKTFCHLIKIFKKHRFDVIHTHTSKTGFLGRIAAKLTGCKKVIHTVHGISFHKFEKIHKRYFYIFLEIIAGLFCDKFILVNRYYKRKFWFIPKRKIMTIYNGIDFSELRQKIERSDDITRLIFIGRLDKQKSPLDFVKAVEIVIKSYENVEANIVGTGEYYSELMRYIRDNNLLKKVKLLGWRTDVPELLAKSDILCTTSIYEAFGLVFCEAGYTGLPSVATNVEGIPEVVVNNKTGILVPPKQPILFAEAIIKLIKNRKLAYEMGKSAKIYVYRNFGLSNMIERYKELYEL